MSPNPTQSPSRNPWRTAVLVGVGAVVLFMATGAVLAYLEGRESDEAEAVQETAATQTQPTPTVVEDCNRYAAEARRDTGEIAKDGLVGGAIGAGVGAAGGAIAKGGKGAGKGAGIGALVGAVGGTLYGLNEENQRSEAARRAYHACLERRGY